MGIFDIFTSKAADQAAALRQQGLQTGLQQASGLYDQARGALTTNFGQALSRFAGLGDTANNAFQLAGDITGAGGAEGTARAKAAFTTDPGYEFTRDQALEGAARGAAAGGMLASGNELQALQDRAAGLASQQYGNWAQRALQMAGYAPQIASGEAGIDTGLGSALAGTYGTQADLTDKTAVGSAEAAATAAEDRNRASGQFWNTLLGGAQLALKASGLGGFAPGGVKLS